MVASKDALVQTGRRDMPDTAEKNSRISMDAENRFPGTNSTPDTGSGRK
jgi:hypothetical protein